MVKNRAPPTNKKIIVGICVPKKLCNTNPSHQFAIGVNASLICSSKPFSCEKSGERLRKKSKVK